MCFSPLLLQITDVYIELDSELSLSIEARKRKVLPTEKMADTDTHASIPNRGRASTKDEPTRLTARHFPTDVPKNEVGKATEENALKDTLYMCVLCDVGLCVTPCFGIYHTKTHYKATELLY
ncbi:piggyBac transposable element-derived protein 4-like [Aphis craccivora]|uniref:PiggyBac transposable element-derived protein 4-like n=1 Tax=Aphis craccivora TaxID=307492 RepID=A0A6G0YFP5_APHCR|nr:piggyBac transposable element-derived protein 4-like [Aphis craccivora]